MSKHNKGIKIKDKPTVYVIISCILICIILTLLNGKINENTQSLIIIFTIFLTILFLIIRPVIIAKKRHLSKTTIIIIALISFLATMFSGIGWLIAYLMAENMQAEDEKPTKEENKISLSDFLKASMSKNLTEKERLTQMEALYKKGMISKEVWEAEKFLSSKK